MTRVGIIGGTGYTAGELLRILLFHPKVEITYVYSTSKVGILVTAVHTDLVGETDLQFVGQVQDVDVLFLCLGHGVSRSFLTENPQSDKVKIIDLGNDFRLDGRFAEANQVRDFVYGLPEFRREEIRKAKNVANPGCFATAIQLALLPLAKAGLLQDEVHIHALTGSTGAGRGLSETSHFSYRNNNISIYKAFSHQHLGEIGMTLTQQIAQGGNEPVAPDLNFLPLRGDFPRGIFASLYTKCSLSIQELQALYRTYYQDAAFTFIVDGALSMKDVINSNRCLIKVEKFGNKVLLTSVIDNLVKGAAGQAIQNMNLMMGWEEKLGLGLKPIGF